MSKEEIIEVIQESINFYKTADILCMTTADWREVEMAFDDMSEWFRVEQEHESEDKE